MKSIQIKNIKQDISADDFILKKYLKSVNTERLNSETKKYLENKSVSINLLWISNKPESIFKMNPTMEESAIKWLEKLGKNSNIYINLWINSAQYEALDLSIGKFYKKFK